MRAVNLLPRDLDSGSDKTRTPVLVLAAGLGLVTAAALALVFSTSGTISDRRADLEAAESALRVTSSSRESSAPAQGIVVQERTDRVAALAAALTSRIPLDGLLRQLAYVLPADAWLTGLSLTTGEASRPSPGATPPASAGAPGTSGAAGGTTVTIDGATYSQESVARVLSRLAIVPSLEDVQLTKSELVQPQAAPDQPGAGEAVKPKTKKAAKKKPSVVTFSISATYAKGTS